MDPLQSTGPDLSLSARPVLMILPCRCQRSQRCRTISSCMMRKPGEPQTVTCIAGAGGLTTGRSEIDRDESGLTSMQVLYSRNKGFDIYTSSNIIATLHKKPLAASIGLCFPNFSAEFIQQAQQHRARFAKKTTNITIYIVSFNPCPRLASRTLACGQKSTAEQKSPAWCCFLWAWLPLEN